MAVLPALLVAAAALAFLGGCGEGTEPGEATVTAKPFSKLDCGHGRAGSKAAFRQFAEILASGDEAQIRAMLVDQPRFAWISAQGGVTGPEVSVRRDPDAAAAAVADRGGLPFQITRFQNPLAATLTKCRPATTNEDSAARAGADQPPLSPAASSALRRLEKTSSRITFPSRILQTWAPSESTVTPLSLPWPV